MSQKPIGSAALLLAMLLATLAVTVGVALALFAEPERTHTFVLSLAMLCVAEVLVFAFPIYHARLASDRRSPSFVYAIGYQSTLMLYAAGVVLLCLLAGTLSFRGLVVAHSIWFLVLILASGAVRLASGNASQIAATATEQRAEFAIVKSRLAVLNDRVRLERSPGFQPFAQAMSRLADDVSFAAPETLPGTEHHTSALLAGLERVGAEYQRVRSSPAAIEQADVQALVDMARSLGALVRERNAAVLAAR